MTDRIGVDMTERTCTIEGCERKHRRNGLCDMHDQRMKRTGTTDPPPEFTPEMRAETARRYRAAHPEMQVEALRRYRESHREQRNAGARARYAANREAGQERSRAYGAANRERMRELCRAYYAANRDALRESNRLWYAQNPLAARAIWAEKRVQRIALQNGSREGRIDFAGILREHGMVCHICGLDIPSLAVLHFDHVIPLSKGGPHISENIRPAHAICNVRKGSTLNAPSNEQPVLAAG